ncbi:UNKNOWN [Stylonychia lemnae]|uniref:Uncharacterized protein n=1 Tax=Stylonychia lemnae TaxID=5949 RepID=A0A077ZNJ6_STYLE|nr:UNKNOWN [Stylonychia lemnae]|eukprot:CDW71547.1 UNKNOWN [Stylonychia lemnae]
METSSIRDESEIISGSNIEFLENHQVGKLVNTALGQHHFIQEAQTLDSLKNQQIEGSEHHQNHSMVKSYESFRPNFNRSKIKLEKCLSLSSRIERDIDYMQNSNKNNAKKTITKECKNNHSQQRPKYMSSTIVSRNFNQNSKNIQLTKYLTQSTLSLGNHADQKLSSSRQQKSQKNKGQDKNDIENRKQKKQNLSMIPIHDRLFHQGMIQIKKRKEVENNKNVSKERNNQNYLSPKTPRQQFSSFNEFMDGDNITLKNYNDQDRQISDSKNHSKPRSEQKASLNFISPVKKIQKQKDLPNFKPNISQYAQSLKRTLSIDEKLFLDAQNRMRKILTNEVTNNSKCELKSFISENSLSILKTKLQSNIEKLYVSQLNDKKTKEGLDIKQTFSILAQLKLINPNEDSIQKVFINFAQQYSKPINLNCIEYLCLVIANIQNHNDQFMKETPFHDLGLKLRQLSQYPILAKINEDITKSKKEKMKQYLSTPFSFKPEINQKSQKIFQKVQDENYKNASIGLTQSKQLKENVRIMKLDNDQKNEYTFKPKIQSIVPREILKPSLNDQLAEAFQQEILLRENSDILNKMKEKNQNLEVCSAQYNYFDTQINQSSRKNNLNSIALSPKREAKLTIDLQFPQNQRVKLNIYEGDNIEKAVTKLCRAKGINSQVDLQQIKNHVNSVINNLQISS